MAKEPSGNKYNYAGQWNIKTVSVEWMQHSLERGMILEEGYYSLLLQASERGNGAWLRRVPSITSLGKRPREGELVRTNSRKLRRTASARLSSENTGIWSNIVGQSVKQEHAHTDKWHDRDEDIAPIKAEGPITAVLQTSGEQRFQRKAIQGIPNVPDRMLAKQEDGIFGGKTFVLYGFGEKKASPRSCGKIDSLLRKIIRLASYRNISYLTMPWYWLVYHQYLIRVQENLLIPISYWSPTRLPGGACLLYQAMFSDPRSSPTSGLKDVCTRRIILLRPCTFWKGLFSIPRSKV